MKKLIIILTVIFAIIFANESKSQDLDNSWKVYFHNNYSKTIYVAVHVMDYKTDEWETKYWTIVGPGQKALVFHTNNKFFYYYVLTQPESNGKYDYWGGKDLHRNVEKRMIKEGKEYVEKPEVGFKKGELPFGLVDSKKYTVHIGNSSKKTYIPPEKNWRVYFENDWVRNIYLAVHYMKDGQWETKYWYELEPGEKSYIFETDNSIFYYYGYNIYSYFDGRNWHDLEYHWGGSSYWEYIYGEYRYFKKAKINYDSMHGQKYTITLNR